jgi:hypothetical protein
MRSRVSSVGLIVRPNPASGYRYPDHIDRASLDALPRQPGVYLFIGHDGAPVYIGKSVCLRSRVLSHLRTPEEAAMLRDTARVEFLRTAGDIGALLLESRLIKQMQPPYNALLRMVRDTYALGLHDDDSTPVVCSSGTRLPSRQLFGLFGSRASAEEALRALARRHGLCPALLGLEPQVCGRGCFSRQLGRCNGACVGTESAPPARRAVDDAGSGVAVRGCGRHRRARRRHAPDSRGGPLGLSRLAGRKAAPAQAERAAAGRHRHLQDFGRALAGRVVRAGAMHGDGWAGGIRWVKGVRLYCAISDTRQTRRLTQNA